MRKMENAITVAWNDNNKNNNKGNNRAEKDDNIMKRHQNVKATETGKTTENYIPHLHEKGAMIKQ